MNKPQSNSPRDRLKQLLAIPERQRTEEEWDELNELEIMFAAGNRDTGQGYRDSGHDGRGNRDPGHGQRGGNPQQGQGQGQGQRKPDGGPGGGGARKGQRKFHKKPKKNNNPPR